MIAQRRQVVVTGLGAIAPSGHSAAAVWEAARSGRSAVDVLTGYQFDGLAVRIGAQVRAFESDLPRVLARRISPVTQWAIAAADQAIAQAISGGAAPVGGTAADARRAEPTSSAGRPLLGAEGSNPVTANAGAASNTVPADKAPANTAVHANSAAPASSSPTRNPAVISDAAAPQQVADRTPTTHSEAPTTLWDPSRVVVFAATGSGPVDAMQQATLALHDGGPRSVPLTLAIYGAPDSAAALLSQRYGFTGAARGVCATCASSAVALGEAQRAIRHGYADAAIVVGMEDCLNPVNLASNANMRALAAGFEEAPHAASRPFDDARRGFVMGAGAAAIVLESASTARVRGATPLAELAGFGAASDAHHPTAPHPQGRGAAAAMRDCLADAGLDPADVDHINAHGTGTPAGDAAELAAVTEVFGADAQAIPISATKSSTGHLLGASGALEAIIAIGAMREGILPPTLNLENSAFPGFDIVTRPRHASIRTVLSNSFGFGGHNGAVLLRAWRDTP